MLYQFNWTVLHRFTGSDPITLFSRSDPLRDRPVLMQSRKASPIGRRGIGDLHMYSDSVFNREYVVCSNEEFDRFMASGGPVSGGLPHCGARDCHP